MRLVHQIFYCFMAILPCVVNAQLCTEQRIVRQANRLMTIGEFKLAKDTINFGIRCLGDTSVSLLLIKYEAQRNLRKSKSALKAAKQAENHLERENGKDHQFFVLLALAEIYALRKNKESSEQYLQAIRNIIPREKLDVLSQARIKFIEGLLLLELIGKENEVLENYQEALRMLETIPANEAVYLRGQLLRILGNRARVRTDFPVAQRYYLEELALYQKHYLPGHADIAIAHYNAGSICYEMHEHQAALDHYLQCYEVWKKEFDRSSRYYRFLTEAIGDMYWELGDRSNALKFFDLSTEEESVVNRDSGIWLNLAADTLLSDGKHGAALEYYEQALNWRSRNLGVSHPLTVACQNFVGRAFQAAGKDELALSAFAQSIFMLGADSIELNTSTERIRGMSPGSVQYLLEALSGKGAILLQEAEKENNIQGLVVASETLLLAVNCLEYFRRSPLSEPSKLFWNQRSIPLLENAIRAQVLLYRVTGSQQHLENAFTLSEKSRAFLLRSAFQKDQVMQFAGVPLEVTDEEQRLRRELLHYDNKILSEERRCLEARQKQLDLWREKQASLRHEYEILLNEIKQSYPRYFSLKYQSPVITVSETQTILAKERMALIEFFEGKKQVYIFYLDAQQLKIFEVANNTYQSLSDSLTALLADEEQFLSQPALAFQSYTQSAQALYQLLLEPALSNSAQEIERLLIVPGEKLSTISFACLLTDQIPVGKRAYDQLPYLLRSYAISYTTSASVWRQSLQANSQGQTTSIYTGFAPDYSEVIYPGIKSPGSLPFSQQEIAVASQLFAGKTFIGKKATEKAFREQASSLLHVAAHAWVDDAQPLLSKLLLVPADTTEDGILYAYELYGMQLPAQLSILSACHSAAGQFERGEGIMSLERAFQYAGCPSLLSSFWAADDESSARLTRLFLEAIKKRESKDKALQKAQLQFLQEGDPALAIPFYWAGFRMAGNVKPLKLREENNWNWLWVVTILFGCFTIGAIYRKWPSLFSEN